MDAQVMPDRPDYIKCIKLPLANVTTTWCGQELGPEWTYTGLDHAAADRLSGGRLLPCPDCVRIATLTLENTDA